EGLPGRTFADHDAAGQAAAKDVELEHFGVKELGAAVIGGMSDLDGALSVAGGGVEALAAVGGELEIEPRIERVSLGRAQGRRREMIGKEAMAHVAMDMAGAEKGGQ